jgi:hypothetical protein
MMHLLSNEVHPEAGFLRFSRVHGNSTVPLAFGIPKHGPIQPSRPTTTIARRAQLIAVDSVSSNDAFVDTGIGDTETEIGD